MTFTRQLNEREQEAIRNIQRQAEQNNARMLGAVQQAQEQPRGNGIRVLDPGEANRQDMERVARPLHPERLRQQEESQQRRPPPFTPHSTKSGRISESGRICLLPRSEKFRNVIVMPPNTDMANLRPTRPGCCAERHCWEYFLRGRVHFVMWSTL